MEDEVRGAIAPGALDPIAQIPLGGEAQAAFGEGGAGDVAGEALQEFGLARGAGDSGMEREAVGAGELVAFVLEVRRESLQGEGFLTGVGTDSDAVGDGRLLQGQERGLILGRLGIVGEGEARILTRFALAREIAQPLETPADTLSDALDENLEL